MFLNSEFFRLKAIAETSDDFIDASHNAIKHVLIRRRYIARKLITVTLDINIEQNAKLELDHLDSIIKKFYSL